MRVSASTQGFPAGALKPGTPVTLGVGGDMIGEVVSVNEADGSMVLDLPPRALGRHIDIGMSISIDGLDP